MDPLQDVIAAFADGEPVDPHALKDALAEPQGRDQLIDVLVLRGMMGAPPPARPVQVNVVRPQAPFARRWLAIAALVTVAAAGGFAAGLRRAPAPPAPVVLVDNTVPAPEAAAPAPTRVIHLRSGVDWREQQGGGD